jgi:hypothetical protein
MNRLFLKLNILAITIVFSGCANMEIGFEEDSPFYTKPVQSNNLAIDKKTNIYKNNDKLSNEDTEEGENETTFYYEFVED